MRWFGESWNAPVNDEVDQAPTPVGSVCEGCSFEIAEDDRGVLIPEFHPGAAYGMGTADELPYHLRCMMAAILGPAWREMTDALIDKAL